MKAKTIELAKSFTDIPNVGKRVAEDLKNLGFKTPIDLKNQDVFTLYKKLCKLENQVVDPCMLDTFMAIVDFADNGNARKWWHYTNERKKKYNI